jgi:hypothetical protein
MSRQWTFQKQLLSPLQALDMLCRTLYAEGLPEACDYLGLHMGSTQVLLSMYGEFTEEYLEVTGMNLVQEERYLLQIWRILLGLWKNATTLQLKRYITTLGTRQ